MYGYFTRQTSEIVHKISWTWQRKGNFKIETESLLQATQNNAIRINKIKAKIDKRNRIVSVGCMETEMKRFIPYRKRQQTSKKEYKSRCDWLGKVIHWELYKRLKFDHNNKWYMYKQESLVENDTHEILRYKQVT